MGNLRDPAILRDKLMSIWEQIMTALNKNSDKICASSRGNTKWGQHYPKLLGVKCFSAHKKSIIKLNFFLLYSNTLFCMSKYSDKYIFS